MRKQRFYIFCIACLVAVAAFSQQDKKAKDILDQVANTYKQSEGMQIDFKGTQQGTLWIKGDKFVLDCGGVKSWFDGETQWSYVADNEEINISSPTPEEVQAVNPYVLVTMYQKGFDYRYNGYKSRNGKGGNEIILTPIHKQDIRMFLLLIGKDYIPSYIGIDMTNGHYEEFIITKVVNLKLCDEFFRFNESLYPNAEVIDLR